MAIIDYDKQIAIDILEKSHVTTKLKVCTKEKPYYVKCYYTGNEKSSSYVIKVYDNEKGLLYDNHLIAVANVDSTGSTHDNSLQLEDEAVEQAIMDVLFNPFNKKSIVY